jgi:hypothetical protein
VMLLAPAILVGLQAPVAAALLGTVASAVTGVTLFFLLDRILRNRGAALFWALLAVALGPITYLALSGMETALLSALALLSIYACATGRYPAAGLLLALLVLTRIESLALAGTLCLAVIAMHRGRALRPFLWVSIPPVATLLLFSLYNLTVTGSLLPTTMAGRKWLWGLPDATIAFTPGALAHYLDTWRLYIEGWLFHVHALPEPVRFLYRVLIWGLLAGGVWLLIRETFESIRGGKVTPAVLLFGWVVAHNTVYLILSPFPSIRHQVPNLLLVILLLATVWRAVAGYFHTRAAPLRVLPAILPVLVALGLLPTAWEWQKAYADHVDQINRVHVAAGRWIAANLPEGARVAAFDIGAVAYFGEHQVLDLGGLVEHDFASRYLHPRQVGQYLLDHEVDYLALPEEGPPLSGVAPRLGLDDTAHLGLALQRIASFAIDVEVPRPFNDLPYYYYIPALWQMGIYQVVSSR